MKYSSRGLINQKGLISVLFEKLYFTILFSLLFASFLLEIITIHDFRTEKKSKQLWYSKCLYLIDKDKSLFTSMTTTFIYKTFIFLFMIMFIVLFLSIDKIKSKPKFRYKQNILSLKETLIVLITHGIYSFSTFFPHDMFPVLLKMMFLKYLCLYFLSPLYLLVSLRKSIPEFYTHSNAFEIKANKFYVTGQTQNLTPRPVFTKIKRLNIYLIEENKVTFSSISKSSKSRTKIHTLADSQHSLNELPMIV